MAIWTFSDVTASSSRRGNDHAMRFTGWVTGPCSGRYGERQRSRYRQ